MLNKITICDFDKDTKYAKLVINAKVYSLQAIYAASYVFLDRAYILLDQDPKGNIEAYIFIKDNKERDLKKLGLEFFNELVNYSHYFSRVESNSGIMKTIMQRVLFATNPKFAEEAEEQEIQDLLKELEKDSPVSGAKK